MVDTGLYIGPDNAPDRYRLLRSIGRGGEAVLYLAELELSGATEPVVVKVLDARQTLSQEMFAKISEKWREQAELLRFVHRLGVVGIREHFEGPSAHPAGAAGEGTGGRALYLVMNHVEGLDLRDWRAERALATPAERREAVRCLEQLADVLDWLHSGTATPSGRTVVHGDLSPGNVMIDANGQATLVDFGLSKLTADHQTAEVWFTPGFAAPEVFEGKRTPATDRYAFGAIAYFLLSGLSPATMPETLRAALLDLPELTMLDEDKAARIASIFAVDPAQRPDSLGAWVKELRPAVISTTTRPPLPMGAPKTPSAPPAVPPAPATPPPPAHAPGGVAPTVADPVVPAAPAAPPVPAYTPPPAHTPPAAEPPRQPDRPPVQQQPAVQQPPIQQAAVQQQSAARPIPEPVREAVPDSGPGSGADAGPASGPRSVPGEAAPAADAREATGPTTPLPRSEPEEAGRSERTAVLGSGGLPPSGDGGGSGGKGGSGGGAAERRSRKPQVIGALVVAALLIGGGAYAGVALSGHGKKDDNASAKQHTSAPANPPSRTPAQSSPSAAAQTPGTDTSSDPSATDTPTSEVTMTPGTTELLTTENPVDGNDSFETQNAAVNGTQYYNALVTNTCFGGSGYTEYNLGRNWSEFKVTLGLDDNGKNLPVLVTVKADGNQLFQKQLTLGKPYQEDFNVSGALRLRVEWAANDNGDGCGTAVLANPTLVH
ncbi:protein kinase [Streptomyces sp. HPF1205]|uniref:protein kinase domain-containing protein n=1 Tax=Streptomyces sp. HPF1205 TaxID=2873262 RepID=UPI001CEC57CE|nr:protein kinase [Streptomyces sp. HPF1205]